MIFHVTVFYRGYGPLLLVTAAMTRLEIETIKKIEKREFSGFRIIFFNYFFTG